MSNQVTNRDLYNAISELRGEFTETITRLINGKISRLEDRVTRLEISQAVSGTKLAILISAITLVVSTIVAVITRSLFR